jgi:hypothetical protein
MPAANALHTDQVFLSYSRNDLDAALNLRAQFDRHGLPVFRDADEIRQGELWLERLQTAVDSCTGFVVLVVATAYGAGLGPRLRRL